MTAIKFNSICRALAIVVAAANPALAEDDLTLSQSRCAANLRQIGTAIASYCGDHTNEYPAWLSCLYPTYIKDKSILICPSDASRGAEGSKPDRLHKEMGEVVWRQNQFMETDDCARQRTTNCCGRNIAVSACSYFYELNAAKCIWVYRDGNLLSGLNVSTIDRDGNGELSWQEVKLYQMTHGNRFWMSQVETEPCDSNRFPIVRCYHHCDDAVFQVGNTKGDSTSQVRQEGLTLNRSLGGGVFRSPFTWEVGSNDVRRVK